MKINIVLDFIYKKRIEFLLSIMAGVFLFYFFDTYVLEYDHVFFVEKEVQQCFDKNLSSIFYVDYKDYLTDNYIEFYKELYSLNGFENYGTFDDSSSYFWEYGVDYNDYFYPDGFELEDSPDYRLVDVYCSCAELLNIYDIDGNQLILDNKKQRMVVEERQRTKSDDNIIEVFPIYVGYDFQDSIPIGTILKQSYVEEDPPPGTSVDDVEFKQYEYIVVGYLAKNQSFLSDNSIQNGYGDMMNLDRTIILLKDDLVEDYFALYPSGFYFTSKSPDKIMTDIKELAGKYDVRIEVKSVREIINTIKKEQLSEIKYYGVMFALMICVALIFISFTSLMIFMSRKNEIGILYANGISHKDINFLIFTINMICTIISGCLAFTIRTVVLSREYGYGDSEQYLKIIQIVRNMYVSWQMAIICLLIALISSVISIKVLGSYSIRDLIGNNE